MISVMIPSRNRPDVLKTSIQSLSLSKNGLEALVWLDDDDPKLDTYKEFFEKDPNIKLFIKKRVGYKNHHLMCNFLYQQAKYDWILLFSDDAYMNNPQWFEKFCDFVKEFEPANQPVVINIWAQEDTKHNLFPFVSRKFIDILGHFSLFYSCDTWVHWVALGAGVHYSLKGIKPVHMKWAEGKNLLKDTTFFETERDKSQIKHIQDPRRSPFRHLIKEDTAKIISYNLSRKRRKNNKMLLNMESSKITPLCKIAYKYGTDKCPQIKHSYTPFYYKLLNGRRKSIKKVLEIGIGYYKTMKDEEIVYDKGLKRYYHKGASLKMWRDFFPNAQIFGADIRPETLFEDKRIKTYLCDEGKKDDLVRLIENTGSDIDVVIDDASHHVDDQIFLATTILPLLKKDVIYVIEDVGHSKKIAWALGEGYNYLNPPIPRKWSGGMLFVIRNKSYGIK